MKANTLFKLPDSLHASIPPEKRGIRRDQVKLMVINRRSGETLHDYFHQIERYVKKGDIFVLNNSRTIPAEWKVMLVRNGSEFKNDIKVRLAGKAKSGRWQAFSEYSDLANGDRLIGPEGMEAVVSVDSARNPFIELDFSVDEVDWMKWLYRNAKPIQYEYADLTCDLTDYQTVFATVPGSVEMPSAGRAFTWELLSRLKKRGVQFVFLHLHTGLSYLSEEYWPLNPNLTHEMYTIPEETWNVVRSAKENENRVIAVGTTVVRAIETAAQTNQPSGHTNLVIGPHTELKMIDGILTGLHEPEASHLDLLSSLLPTEKIIQAYEEAIAHQYMWHEFGDMNLII